MLSLFPPGKHQEINEKREKTKQNREILKATTAREKEKKVIHNSEFSIYPVFDKNKSFYVQWLTIS